MASTELQFQTERKRQWFSRNYDRAAWFYETSARVYSGNQISLSKSHQLNFIAPGDKTVFLGVGSGEDAVNVAAMGSHVTCVDISKGMLASLNRKLTKRKLQCQLIRQNVLDFQPASPFDVCCANYFLNMFQEPDMIKILGHAAKLIRPGGRLMIADVACDDGHWLSRTTSMCYRKFAMIGFWVLGLAELHPDYDYRKYLPEFGLEIENQKLFRLGTRGPVAFQCIVAKKC